MGRAINGEERKELCEKINNYLANGLFDYDIAKKVGVSERTIYKWRSEGYVHSASRGKPGVHAKAIDPDTLEYETTPLKRLDGTPLPFKDEPETEIPFGGDDAFTDDCKDYCELEPVQDEKVKTVPLLKREVKISGDYIEVTEKNGNFKMELLGSVESDGKSGLVDVLSQVIAECQEMMAELEG